MKKLFVFITFLVFAYYCLAQSSYDVYVATPGTLNTVLINAGANKALVSELSITGNINYLDIEYMRDSMPILAVLDLSLANIEDNFMPICSFYNAITKKGKESLTHIKLPNNLTAIGNYAFLYCSNLQDSLIIPESVTYIGSEVFCFCSGFTGTLKIPNSVSYIDNGAFGNCSGFTGDVVLPNSLKAVGHYLFYGCKGIEKINISENITSIGRGAFIECSKLDSFIVDTANVSFCSIDGVLFSKDTLELLQYPMGKIKDSYAIPEKVTTIKQQSFYKSTGLTGSLIIPDSVRFIEQEAFYNCTGITGDLVIPKTVQNIDLDAFNGCSGLNGSLTVFNSSTSFFGGSFSCKNISKIYVDAKIPTTVYLGTFYDVDKNKCELIVPIGSVDAYKAADGWNEFKIN
jgi:hypothetical protein